MPGHLLLCGHACLMGAIEATGKLLSTGDAGAWSSDFASASRAAADAVSPVTGFVVGHHVLPAPADA